MEDLSPQLRAAIINDFLLKYNSKWGEDWTIGISTTNNRVDIFRESVKCSCDGHFIGKLADFCRDTFGTIPCVGYFFGHLLFWI